MRTVEGTWLYPDGTPAVGEIVFTPAQRVTDRAADGWQYLPADYSPDFAQHNAGTTKPYPVMVSAGVVERLDAAGHMSASLTILPDPLVWLITERIDGTRHAVWALTLTDDPAPLNLGDVTADMNMYPLAIPRIYQPARTGGYWVAGQWKEHYEC